jgi:hypothetical protein
MDKKELKKFALKQLHTKQIQKIRNQVCKQFVGKEQKQCRESFDKSFVKSFMQSAQRQKL